MKILPVLTAALLLCSCAADRETEALKNSINIPPTGYVNQGSFINIIVARDVDFGGVYERVNPHLLPLDAGDAKIRQ